MTISTSGSGKPRQGGTNGLLVAIAEDDRNLRESLGNIFEASGFGVRLFATANPLLNAPDFEDFDCIVADVGLPDIRGTELQVLVRSRRPELPVFLMTGRYELAERSAPGERFFLKPFNPVELLDAVHQALRSTS